MHRSLLPALVLFTAVPAAAQGFAEHGAWVVGGDLFFSRSDLDLGSRTVEKTQVEVSPELTWFFADRLGLRFAPGLRYQEQGFTFSRGPDLGHVIVTQPESEVAVDAGASDEQLLLGLAAGPVYYLPLAGPMHLGLGAHLRYDVELVADDADASGFGYGGEVSLAYLAGEAAVVELGARYTNRSLSRKREGFKAEEQDLEDFLLGFRLGLVL